MVDYAKIPYMDQVINRLRGQAQMPASGSDVYKIKGGGTGTPTTPVTVDRSRPGIVQRALNSKGGKVVGALSVAGAVNDQLQPGANERYAKRFGVDGPGGVVAKMRDPMNPVGMADAAKLTALKAGGFVTDVVDRASFGIIGNLLYPDKQGPGVIPSAQAAPGGAGGPPGEIDLGNNQTLMPRQQQGVVQSLRPPKASPSAPKVEQQPQQQQQPLYQPVQVPNVANAMDVDTLPAFFQQLQGAQQTVANNAAARGNRKGIIAATRGQQDLEKGQMELDQAKQLNAIFQQVQGLTEANDPGATLRRQLMDQAAILQGKNPGERFDFKTVQGVDPATLESIQQLVRVDPRTGEYQFLGGAQPGAQPAAEQPPVAGAQKAPDGKWYVKQGDKWFRVDQ